jgi:hypothetical protein
MSGFLCLLHHTARIFALQQLLTIALFENSLILIRGRETLLTQPRLEG